MGKVRLRRRAPKIDTARMEAIVACAEHLRDLKRVHGAPPPDIEVATSGTPHRLAPMATNSYCTSPAELCAELVK